MIQSSLILRTQTIASYRFICGEHTITLVEMVEVELQHDRSRSRDGDNVLSKI